jgi:ABC-type antimicrobial peptide transport system permease subunit
VRAAGKTLRVVGMARDSKYFSPAEASSPHFYLAFAQFYSGSPELYFLVRTAGLPAQSIPLLRRAVTDTDPNASAFHAIPLAEYTEVATFGQKVAADLMAALGLMSLLLAAMGLYSVMSYTVSQRIAEIGIRMAMGARPWNVISMVVAQGMSLALAGMAVGAVAAFAVTRLVASLLFRVDAADPLTFVLAGLFLCAVALVATWLPAFRATRIDPMPSLRR